MPHRAMGHSQALEPRGAETAAPVPGLDVTLQHLLASDRGWVSTSLSLSYFVYEWA